MQEGHVGVQKTPGFMLMGRVVGDIGGICKESLSKLLLLFMGVTSLGDLKLDKLSDSE